MGDTPTQPSRRGLMPLSGSSPLDDPTVIVCSPPAPLVPPTPPSAASTCGVVPCHHLTLPPHYRHLWRHRWSWLRVRHCHHATVPYCICEPGPVYAFVNLPQLLRGC
ncbi:hypothetical protein BDA96_01G038900 [Sorghum bicolor]|uniref:Uncharacterized protein n=2 Tax=Sorghum bicolor TaxID=4558 RepID=A0A921UX57_SORBI|nr:hypothetical protein SORBI_3001G037550 [Sorghum bicolor]KAG0546973.1 hypothetical protein BDA96_01G038900 [Sorghum bicolor]